MLGWEAAEPAEPVAALPDSDLHIVLEALVAQYPDARFIVTHRDPGTCVASTANMARAFAHTFAAEQPGAAFGSAVKESGSLVYSIIGYLEFRAEEREQTISALREVATRSRQDEGCLEYWWSEDVLEPNRFRFFESWESKDAFDAHQAQPYEVEFMTVHVSRITGADAHVLTITDRTSAMG